MAFVTLQVIDGFEKGRLFEELSTPVTIGREEDNSVQLNDERVSRFHAKIQDEDGRLILTDLDSTNGTRVNGHPVQVRVLQFGDQLTFGRSVLVVGGPAEIEAHYRQEQKPLEHENATIPAPVRDSSRGDDFPARPLDDVRSPLFPSGPPQLPTDLRPLQIAQLSDVLAYVHEQLALLTDAGMAERPGGSGPMRVPWAEWQRLLKLQMELARWLRSAVEPKAGE